MDIVVNGQQVTLEKSISLLEFIQRKGLNPETLVVQHNLQVLGREQWGQTWLEENDQLELLKFVGGG